MVARITTDSDGTGTVRVPAGTYYVKEISPSKGYGLDQSTTTIEVTASNDEDHPYVVSSTEPVTVEEEDENYYITVTKSPEDYSDNEDFTLYGTDGKLKDGYSIEGAIYGIYESTADAAADTNAVTRVTTDESGSVTVDLTDLGKGAGEYYVKEITASEGFDLDEHIYYVNLTEDARAGGIPSTEPAKDAEYNVYIEKSAAAASSSSLEGAEYGIYSDAGCTTLVKTLTTDENGIATGRVDAGSYWVKETSAPSGYGLDTTVRPITVANGAVTSVASTEPVRSNLTLTKTAASGTPFALSLEGATYGVFTSADDAANYPNDYTSTSGETVTPEVLETLITDENGKASIYIGTAGDYWVREISAPEGYGLDSSATTPVKVTITNPSDETETHEITSSEPVAATIFLTKTAESATDLTIANAVYGVFTSADDAAHYPDSYTDASGNTVNPDVQGVLITDEDGHATFNTEAGNYWIKEISAPDGFGLDATVYPVTVTGNAGDYEEVNSSESLREYTITITKTASSDAYEDGQLMDGFSLDGAEFRVYADETTAASDWDADGNFLGTAPYITSATTDAYGRATAYISASEFSASNTYYVREVSPSPGFALNTTGQSVTIDAGTKTGSVEFVEPVVIDEDEGYAIDITKVSKDDTPYDDTANLKDGYSLGNAVYGVFETELQANIYLSGGYTDESGNHIAATDPVYTLTTEESGRKNKSLTAAQMTQATTSSTTCSLTAYSNGGTLSMPGEFTEAEESTTKLTITDCTPNSEVTVTNSSGTVVATGTANASGTATLTVTPSGDNLTVTGTTPTTMKKTYYVKEIQASAGFELDTAVYEVDFENGTVKKKASGAESFTEDEDHLDYSDDTAFITSVEPVGEPEEDNTEYTIKVNSDTNVRYVLYSSLENIQSDISVTSASTSTTGIATFSGLTHGTYYPIADDEGYYDTLYRVTFTNGTWAVASRVFGSSDDFTTVTAQTTGTTATVTASSGGSSSTSNTITVKTVNSSGSALSGATVTLYTDAACTTTYGTQTTNAAGAAAFTVAQNSTYYAKVTASPTGYAADNTVYTIAVVSSNVTQTITLNATSTTSTSVEFEIVSATTSGITVLAKSSSTGDTVSGIQFGIYDTYDKAAWDSDEAVNGVYGRTGSDGTVTLTTSSGSLTAGETYYIAMTDTGSTGLTVNDEIKSVTIPDTSSGAKASGGLTFDDDTFGTSGFEGTSAKRKSIAETLLQSITNLGTVPVYAEGTGSGTAKYSLAGAQYVVKYYDNTSGTTTGTPKATWYFETDEDGIIQLISSQKISGPNLYTDSSGRAVMPIGTVTIQETKAPYGFNLNDTLYTVIFEQTVNGENPQPVSLTATNNGKVTTFDVTNMITTENGVYDLNILSQEQRGVTLMTGGAGRKWIYIIGIAGLVILIFFAARRKKKEEDGTPAVAGGAASGGTGGADSGG